MFSKQKPRPKKNHSGKNLSQYGLFDIPTDVSFEENGSLDDEADSDLERELAALHTSDVSKPKKQKRSKPVAPAANLDVMIAESLKDIPSDEEISGDEDDPDLLNELSEITGDDHREEPSPTISSTPTNSTGVLQDRLKMYELAEANAKAAGETSRARRFTRGIKTLKDLIKQANAGQVINNDDIPPEVSVTVHKSEPVRQPSPPKLNEGDIVSPVLNPTRAAPAPPKPVEESKPAEVIENKNETKELSEENKKLLELFNQRRNEYRNAAVVAKKAGDAETAITYVKVVKAFEAVIKAVESGQTVDLTDMPGPPPPYQPKKEENAVQKDEDTEKDEVTIAPTDDTVGEEQLISAGSLAEALEQRLEVYKKQEETAKEQGNPSKARRMGRIVKQYEQAIKLHKSGKPIPVDELPTPPGYAPLPVPGGTAPPSSSPVQPPQPSPSRPAPKLPSEPTSDKPAGISKPTPPPKPIKMVKTRADKQVELLLARQKEFKVAALHAKQNGEMDQAKEFLRTAKGFEPLIDASRAGLPVDISSLPVPPSAKSQLDNEYELVMAEECTEDDTDRDVLSRLESQLNKQLKMCMTTRDHNKAIGDVAGSNRFEQLAVAVGKDLDIVRLAKRTPNSLVPKFHYETREFSIVKTFTELNDNDLELCVVRGINYNCSNPKDVDTYVKFEFPYPQEEPFKDKTATIKNTNNPEYNATYTIPIQRTVRTCLRVFKRHSVKLEVYSKGGFFRADNLLGTVHVKLQPLETQCEIHDSFDLMDGRKKTGGKLEVKIRVRNPLVSKQVEQITEKWLVIDH